MAVNPVISSSYQQLFDKLAPHYRIIDFLSLGTTQYLRRLAIERSAINDGVVVDLMCGTGNNIGILLKRNIEKYIGLDSSAEMMYHAHGHHLLSDRVAFKQCNVLHDLPGGVRADHIVCSYGLKCLVASEYEAFAEAIDALLKPGGTVSILEFRMPLNPVFRFLTSIYVNIFCGIISLIVTGSIAPTRRLVRSMNPPIDPVLMKQLLQNRNFDVVIEERWMSSAVLLYGRKSAENV